MLTDTSSLQVVAAVAPHREKLDACLVFPSMPAVMRLNKLGRCVWRVSVDQRDPLPLSETTGLP